MRINFNTLWHIYRHTIFLAIAFTCYTLSAYAYVLDLPCSFNPVGSGARALGMGGAFIAIADDATSASWNPGGLVQLKDSELSIVYRSYHREEDNTFSDYMDYSGKQSISISDINYLSFSYPFTLIHRPMVLSVNYQQLYDLNNKWVLEGFGSNNDYTQEGILSAYGIAWSVRLVEFFSLGITINFWDNAFGFNGWKEDQYDISYDKSRIYIRKENRSLKGMNANIGILWRLCNERLTIGAVVKLPFNAQIEMDYSYQKFFNGRPVPVYKEYPPYLKDSLEFPSSYGIGLAYEIQDNFRISADLYRTNWQHFIYKSQGETFSPVTGKPAHISQIKPTHQVRLGMEYIWKKEGLMQIDIPFRGGLFYDPSPAEKSPDDFWGVSLGTGLYLNKKHCIDIAWQYRCGNNVREYLQPDFDFSQDVEEHMIYSSYVLHF